MPEVHVSAVIAAWKERWEAEWQSLGAGSTALGYAHVVAEYRLGHRKGMTYDTHDASVATPRNKRGRTPIAVGSHNRENRLKIRAQVDAIISELRGEQ